MRIFLLLTIFSIDHVYGALSIPDGHEKIDWRAAFAYAYRKTPERRWLVEREELHKIKNTHKRVPGWAIAYDDVRDILDEIPGILEMNYAELEEHVQHLGADNLALMLFPAIVYDLCLLAELFAKHGARYNMLTINPARSLWRAALSSKKSDEMCAILSRYDIAPDFTDHRILIKENCTVM